MDWSLTESDGRPGRPAAELSVGSEWLWFGDALRLDGPTDVLPLGQPLNQPEIHERARARAERLTRIAVPPRRRAPRRDGPPSRPGFTVTDGQRAWRGDWVVSTERTRTIAVFKGGLPPIGVPLWVVEIQRPAAQFPASTSAASILPGLVSGTMIATPLGPMPVETLRPGDPVLTRDNGPQAVLGTTTRRFSRRQLQDTPALRPLVVDRTAVNAPPWSAPIRVSRTHRLLVSGPEMLALFSASEVLAEAGHLEGRPGVASDMACLSVEYHTVATSAPQLISAGGHWCETSVTPGAMPDYAMVAPRRVLTASEAAIVAAHAAH